MYILIPCAHINYQQAVTWGNFYIVLHDGAPRRIGVLQCAHLS